VRATAPGKKPFVETVELSTDGARAEIVVPGLAPLSKHVVKPKPRPIVHAKPEPSAEGPRPLTIAGIASGGVGVVALGIGTYFGIRAVHDQSEANDLCPDVQCNNQDAVDLNDDAQRAAGWSTGLLVGGSVVVATGIVLLVLSETETVKLTARDRLAIRW